MDAIPSPRKWEHSDFLVRVLSDRSIVGWLTDRHRSNNVRSNWYSNVNNEIGPTPRFHIMNDFFAEIPAANSTDEKSREYGVFRETARTLNPHKEFGGTPLRYQEEV